VALAQAGERVVIVSCDLRRPRLHDFFALTNGVGFTSVLLGDVPAYGYSYGYQYAYAEPEPNGRKDRQQVVKS